jgi:hypothetical protein
MEQNALKQKTLIECFLSGGKNYILYFIVANKKNSFKN